MKVKKIVFILIAVLTVAVIQSCSTKKNTALRRFYHNTTAYYNIYFNGYESYDAGVKKIDELQENYTTILPVFKSETEQAKGLADADMDRAIKKSYKMIKMHSITAKPKRKNVKSPKAAKKQKEFMKKQEYNKWVDDAYLLIGKSYYQKQEYQTSFKSLQLIVNKFRNEPSKFDAIYWIARSYGALGEYEEAENYLQTVASEKELSKKMKYNLGLAYIDLYIKQEKYEDAVITLKKIIPETKRRKRARLRYILAQIYMKLNRSTEAFDMYSKVIKSNPPYDMAFSAKINMAKSFNKGDRGAEKLTKVLKKMLKDDKNIDYQDQIYYALADIAQKQGDTLQAVNYYKESVRTSRNNQNQKALSYLALGDYYFSVKNYLNAGAYYDSTMSMLDKKFPEYEKISLKAQNLSGLIKNLKIVIREDSLQKIAKMDSVSRQRLIENIIADVKAKESAAQNSNNQRYYPENNEFDRNLNKGKWYFYNPQMVSLGKTEFKRMWGDRKLEDHWRRKNKTVVATFEGDENTTGTDSTGRVTDNKKVEYYLQDLPLSDSLMEASNRKIAKALFETGQIYQKNMKDYPEAITQYEKLNTRFPKDNLIVESYFNLYLIYYKLLKNNAKAELYRNKILKEFPYSKYANILTDPNYLKKLEESRDAVNKYYASAYYSFQNEKYQEVIKEVDEALEYAPKNELLPKFMYLKGMSIGFLGNQKKMAEMLTEIVTKYKTDEISVTAQAVLDVYKSGKYDPNYYTYQPDSAHYYMVVMRNDNRIVNKIVFDLKNYSIETFPAEKFIVEKVKLNEEVMQVVVKEFKNREEADKFINSIVMSNKLEDYKQHNIIQMLISTDNYNKLQKLPIIKKYTDFFVEKYSVTE